jgi:hypothetical protein
MDITKDLLNDILYDNNGNPSEFHNDIITGLKPYLKQNIQLGGGISITTEIDDINELFDDNGILKEQYGGDVVEYVKRFTNIVGFNRYFKKYTKFMDAIAKTNETVNIVHKVVMDNTQAIQELLAEYYAYIKMRVHLQYILKKKKTDFGGNPQPSEIKQLRQYESNIEELERLIEEVQIKLNYGYKSFIKSFKKERFVFRKMKKIDVNMFTVINSLHMEHIKKRNKYHKEYTDKYASIEGELRSLNKNQQSRYNKLLSRMQKYKEYREKVNNNLTKLALKISEIMEVKEQVLARFNVDINDVKRKLDKKYAIDDDVEENISKNLTNVFTQLDELIKSASKMKKDFAGMLEILNLLQEQLINRHNPELNEKSKFAVKLAEFTRKTGVCKDFAELLFEQFAEFKLAYATKDFPPPSLETDFITAENNYKGIKTYFSEIQKSFAVFIQKGSGKAEINPNTVTKFIKAIQGLNIATGGGDLVLYGGAVSDDENKTPLDNSVYYLHTYDMYAIRSNINIIVPVASGPAAGPAAEAEVPEYTQTYLRLKDSNDGGVPGGIYKEIKYGVNINNNGDTKIIYDKLPPGVIMVSEEIEFSHTNNIIPRFVNNLKKLINKPRPLFMTLLYKGEIYIYLINIVGKGINSTSNIITNSINIILYKQISVDKIKSSDVIFKRDIFAEEYYFYLPKDIIELHSINIAKYDFASGKYTKKEVEEQQRKVLFVPTFLKLTTLDYAELLKNTHRGSNPVNSLYKYDIYLPIDTVFNKVLIPYVDIDINDYLVNNKDKGHSISELYKKTFIISKPVVNFLSVEPSKLEILKQLKYVLFFTDENMKIYDNRPANPKNYKPFDISEERKKDIIAIYDDYYNFIQGYNNKLKTITNIKDISSTAINVPETNKIDFMNGKIDKDVLKQYYNDNNGNYSNAIDFFKVNYYAIINKIDINILKYDRVNGIDEMKITAGPSTKLEKFVYSNLMLLKDRLTDKINAFEGIYEELEDTTILKGMQSILKSYDELKVINNDKINFNVKYSNLKIPDIVGADEFYKTQLNNPDDIAITATEKSKKYTQLLSKEGILKRGLPTVVEDIIIVIYPGFEQLMSADVGKEVDLKKAINNSKRDGDKKEIKPLKANYGPLRDLFDTLITEDGAERLIQEIKVFNNKREKKSPFDIYKSNTTFGALNKVYRSEDFIGIGKPLYKLNYYIDSIISSMTTAEATEKKEIYYSKTGAFNKYKDEYTAYVEDLEKKIEEVKEDAKKQYSKK